MKQTSLFADEPEPHQFNEDENWYDTDNRSPEWWDRRDEALNVTGVLDLRDDLPRFRVTLSSCLLHKIFTKKALKSL